MRTATFEAKSTRTCLRFSLRTATLFYKICFQREPQLRVAVLVWSCGSCWEPFLRLWCYSQCLMMITFPRHYFFMTRVIVLSHRRWAPLARPHTCTDSILECIVPSPTHHHICSHHLWVMKLWFFAVRNGADCITLLLNTLPTLVLNTLMPMVVCAYLCLLLFRRTKMWSIHRHDTVKTVSKRIRIINIHIDILYAPKKFHEKRL